MTRTTSTTSPAFTAANPSANHAGRSVAQRPATMRRSWRTLLLTVHVVATVSLLGADLALVALGVSGVRGADPRTVYPAAHLLGSWLLAPLAVVSLGTGVLQGLRTPWGLFRYWWVTIKLGTTIVLSSLLLLLLVPGLARVADIATGPTPELLTEVQRVRLAVAPAVAALMLTLNVVISMYKPVWRLGSRRTG